MEFNFLPLLALSDYNENPISPHELLESDVDFDFFISLQFSIS
jgi:hypothetical protein